MSLRSILSLTALLFAGALQAAALPPLLLPAELQARLDDSRLRIVDIRPPAKDQVFVPGSVSAPYGQWRGPQSDPGKPLDDAALTALLQRLGIEAGTSVVVTYEGRDSTDFGAAARVYWTLKSAGVTNVSILNGGIVAWRAAGLATAAAPATVAPSRYEARLDSRWLATREQVAEAVAGSNRRLLDARPAAFFAGEQWHPAARSPGTLVGAANVEHSVWFVPGTSRLAPPEQLAETARRLGVDLQAPTVSFCNTGHWAATQWFVLSEMLGAPDVRLYAQSMVDWSNSGQPMDNVPGRLQWFWMQLRAAFGN